ncbi:MAG: histidine phosphatase family protein [Anaerolineales bacterium]|nr:histidine phosphatase family protein [Anaerolineales bacterium]
MELYFLRHAQSENNALAARNAANEVRTHDPELTSLGQQQAAHLADFLAQTNLAAQTTPYDPQNRRGVGLTHLYASLMVRAVHTGTVIARRLGLPLTAWPDWHEEGGLFLEEQPGVFVGRPGHGRAYFTQAYPDFILPESLTEAGWWTAGLEPYEDRPRRARRAVAALLERHGPTDDRVGIVSHGGFYNHILAALMDLPAPYRLGHMLNNASITRIVLAPDAHYVVYQNRCEYLPTELITA